MNRSRLLLLTVLFALALVAPPSALAGFGDIDPSFGSGGVARPFLRSSAPDATVPIAVRILPDHRVLVARGGNSVSGGSLIRLTRDGVVDDSFSDVEARASAIRGGSLEDFELLDDGRIVLLINGGPYQQVQTRLALLKANGALDRQFGDQGVVSLGTGATGLRAHSIAVQGQSKILLSGHRDGSTTEITIARFGSDGSPDTSFGEAGVAVVPGMAAGSGQYESFAFRTTALTVAPSGEIYVGVDSMNSASRGAGIAKLSSEGDLIPIYGVGGIAAIPSAFHFSISTVAPTAGGDVGFAGSSSGWNRGAFTLYDAGILNANGDFHDPGGADQNVFRLAGIAPLAEHGFAVGGSDFVRAVSAGGAPDQNFGESGTTSPLLKKCGTWAALDVGQDGEIVAAAADCWQLTLIRLRGRSGGPAAPRALITVPPKPIFRRSSTTRGMSVSGVAGPGDELAKVEIAIRRFAGSRCRWITKAGAESVSLRKHKGKCDKPRFMRATGRAKWQFKLRHALPQGEYQLYVRATTKTGLATPLAKAPETSARFNVMMPSRP